MRFFELIRNKLFWVLDTVKGSEIKRSLRDIGDIIENPGTREVIENKRKKLEQLLQFAVSSTKFYAAYKGYNALQDFPVVNKNSIREHFEDFRSEAYRNKPHFTFSTSGSTGMPFKVYHNKKKRSRNTADTIYFSKLAGFRIGFRLIFFRLWDAFEKKGSLGRILQNVVPVDIFDLQKDAAKKQLLQKMRTSSSLSWLGYASAFESMCKYLEKQRSGKVTSLRSAIAISESLNAYTKQAMTTYFDVDVVSRYSNIENGILAQQPIGNHDYFVINEASYVIEILDIDKDIPVDHGVTGRIVVTDLFNYCMPFIRYDTGDVGSMEIRDGKKVLTHISGRKRDLITDTKGNIITVNLGSIFTKYLELKQCQLIQKAPKTYVFKLNTSTKFLREDVLVKDFKGYLGDDANITVIYVDEIPLLASGKRRVMVNEMESK